MALQTSNNWVEAGLVSIDIPAHLAHISKTNATRSPLLCLPPELRLAIFESVLGGYTIHLQIRPVHVNALFLHLNLDKGLICSLWAKDNDGIEQRVSLSHRFQLPLVSRQIYAETATLVYSKNTFFFRTSSELSEFRRLRLPAQVDAVASIHPPTINDCGFEFPKIFPNLKQIVVRRREGRGLAHSWTGKIALLKSPDTPEEIVKSLRSAGVKKGVQIIIDGNLSFVI